MTKTDNKKSNFNLIAFIKQNHHALVVIMFGLFGATAAFTLLNDKILRLMDPNYIPPCNINPLLSCSTTMDSKYASLFGYPNMFIGAAGYPMAVLAGLFMIASKNYQKWLFRATLLLASIGLVVTYILVYASTYILNVICPWCFVAGVSNSGIVLGQLFWNAKEGNLGKSKLALWLKEQVGKNNHITLTFVYYTFFLLFYSFPFILIYVFNIYTSFPDPIFWLAE